MPRPTTIEDTYDYHVKRIFRDLRKCYDEHGPNKSFDEWLNTEVAQREAGKLFIDDAESWNGIPDAD